MQSPLVTAILPFADPRRLKLVRNAVNNFVKQSYTPYELIIVNGSGIEVLTHSEMDCALYHDQGCRVLETKAPSGLNAASMRNLGIAAASGELIFPIDDDDWCHPDRLLFQMAHRREGRPCMLKNQLLVDISSLINGTIALAADEAIKPKLQLVTDIAGVPSTILFPRVRENSTKLWLYDPALNIGEHVELLARMRQASVIPTLCNNDHTEFNSDRGWPMLSVAIYHTDNELTFDQFFKWPTKDRVRPDVPEGLNQSDMDRLTDILQSVGFRVS